MISMTLRSFKNATLKEVIDAHNEGVFCTIYNLS
jgi:hypothetical protein